MAPTIVDSKWLHNEAYQARLNLVVSKLPEDGTCVLAPNITEKLVDDPTYNLRGVMAPELLSKVVGNLHRLRDSGRVEKHNVGNEVFWARAGTDKSPPDIRIKRKDLYPPDSWPAKVLTALRVTIDNRITIDKPSSYELIIDRLFGKGSVINPFDSELTREECEDGVHAGIFQLLEDGVITENEFKGKKDGTYKLV